MNNKHGRMVRLIALVMAVLLALGAVISALLSFAYAEEALPEANIQCELTMEYLNEEQALRISQRLVYINGSGSDLDRVVFYAPANLLRRQTSLPYDGEDLLKAFPDGYLPGGIELVSVQVDGEDCDWGFQGEDESFLRVGCDLEAGAECVFEFEYYLLLTQNAAFLGVSEDHWRLSDFYFAPARWENGNFILNPALGFTRYTDIPAMDYRASILLPEGLTLAASGDEALEKQQDGICAWTVRAENARDFALVIGKGYKEYAGETASGVQVRLLSGNKKNAKAALETALEAIEVCENYFGKFPCGQIDIIDVDYGPGSLNHSGSLWLDRNLLKEGGWELEHALRVFAAQQYFGRSAWARPVSDAWLSDSISEYVSYLIVEETEGHDAYLKALNEQIVPSLQLTIPGGLSVTSDASLFTGYEYEIVVKNRGAAVFHEMYAAMGKDTLIEGLRIFYEKGLHTDVLEEMDLADALEEASGRSWEKFLTDWLFNIGDYVNQEIEWLD